MTTGLVASVIALILSVSSLVFSIIAFRRQNQRAGDNSTQIQVGSKHWHWDDGE